MKYPIRIENLSKSYRGKPALASLDLHIAPGESTALCGLNGGGKSTLLKLLAGIIHPDQGHIHGLAHCRSSYMPDRLAFPRGIRARDWLHLMAGLRQVDPPTLSPLVRRLGLEEVLDQEVAAYSRGMVQRLVLAQALLNQPDLLLMDEPESGLDPLWLISLEEEVQAIRERGGTVIFSTHLPELAARLSNRILVFAKARITAVEDPAHWQSLSSVDCRSRLGRLMVMETSA